MEFIFGSKKFYDQREISASEQLEEIDDALGVLATEISTLLQSDADASNLDLVKQYAQHMCRLDAMHEHTVDQSKTAGNTGAPPQVYTSTVVVHMSSLPHIPTTGRKDFVAFPTARGKCILLALHATLWCAGTT